ncbi:MAG: hypothetical protein ACSNEK_06235 [Parachlamydiaceae bacterium]
MHISQLHYYQTKIEQGFNIAGGIPTFCIASGAVRALAGTVQAVAASALAAIGAMGHKIAFYSCSEKTIHHWEAAKQEGAEQAIHGVLNILNGLGEIALGLTGVGPYINLNTRATRDFKPRFEYGCMANKGYEEI